MKELNTEGFEQQILQRIPFLISIISLRLGLIIAALGLTFLIGVALAGIACYYYTMFLFEPPDVARWLALIGLMWLFLLIYVALTLLCSTISRSQVLAGGLSFGLLVILAALGAIPRVENGCPANCSPGGQNWRPETVRRHGLLLG